MGPNQIGGTAAPNCPACFERQLEKEIRERKGKGPGLGLTCLIDVELCACFCLVYEFMRRQKLRTTEQTNKKFRSFCPLLQPPPTNPRPLIQNSKNVLVFFFFLSDSDPPTDR